MGEWKESTLGDVSIDGGHYGIAASAVPLDASLPTYLRITDIRDDGTINKSGLTSVDDPNSVEYILSPNDLVIARTGASTGRNYFYDGRDGELVYAGFLIKFSIDPNKIYPQYVKYWFLSPFYKAWLNSHTDGSTRANINAVTLADCPIRFPADLPTQRRIAAVLGALDDKIEVNRKICENLEAQAQALFKAWFVDFEPFGGKRPEGWKMGKLGDVAAIRRESITPDEMDEIVEHYSLPAFDESKFPAFDASESIKSNKFKIGKNSVLLSKLNPRIKRLWDPFVDTESAVASTEFVVFEPFKVAFRYFVYSVLDSEGLYQYSVAHAAGTTNSHQRVTPDDILEYEIVLPAEEDILKYCGVVEPMYASVKRCIKESRALAAMRDALLPKLMSGELAVEKVDG